MLVVAWKLKAENLGFFKFSEWSTGMGSLQYVKIILNIFNIVWYYFLVADLRTSAILVKVYILFVKILLQLEVGWK